MACFIIDWDQHLHPRDVVIMHRMCDMIMGVFGDKLVNAIWMNSDVISNRYVVELLPLNATSDPLILWQSRLNHIGVQFNDSVFDGGRFKMSWFRIMHIMDYLLIQSNGDYCNQINAMKLNYQSNL
eukprot:821449_1